MTPTAINTLLEQECDLCNRLITALQAERELLEQHSFDGLQTLLQQKADLLEQLERCKLQRQQWLHGLGDSLGSSPGMPKPKTIDDWLQATLVQTRDRERAGDQGWLASVEKTAFLVKKARDLQQDCNALNSVNGMIINKARKRARSHLDLLKGHVKSRSLYDSKGNAISSGGSPEPCQHA
jgi:flagellar biosynthesis/type III secretory pathway chaperone